MTPELLDAISKIATIIGALSIPISMIAIWIQVRQQTRLTRAANAQKFFELASPFNMALVQDRHFAELWKKGPLNFQGLDATDQYRYYSQVMWWMMLQELIYMQWSDDLVPASVYDTWQKDLDHFVRRDDFAAMWSRMSPFLHRSFVRHIDSKLAAADRAS